MKHFFCTDCSAECDTEILDLHGTPHQGCTGEEQGLWVGQPANNPEPDDDQQEYDTDDGEVA